MVQALSFSLRTCFANDKILEILEGFYGTVSQYAELRGIRQSLSSELREVATSMRNSYFRTGGACSSLVAEEIRIDEEVLSEKNKERQERKNREEQIHDEDLFEEFAEATYKDQPALKSSDKDEMKEPKMSQKKEEQCQARKKGPEESERAQARKGVREKVIENHRSQVREKRGESLEGQKQKTLSFSTADDVKVVIDQ